MIKLDTNQYALNEVDWALQESYKRAVKLYGVTDWSLELKTTNRKVEEYQLEIAKMILNSLHEVVRNKQE